jgi:hypothetical protein
VAQNVTPEAALADGEDAGGFAESNRRPARRYREMNDQVETYRNQECGSEEGRGDQKAFENQIAKVRDLKKEMDEAAKEQAKFREAALASFKTLGELPAGDLSAGLASSSAI